MSRYTVTKTSRDGFEYVVAYGNDNSLGFFIQVFWPDEDEPIWDRDQLCNRNYSQADMIEEARKYFGFDMLKEFAEMNVREARKNG